MAPNYYKNILNINIINYYTKYLFVKLLAFVMGISSPIN